MLTAAGPAATEPARPATAVPAQEKLGAALAGGGLLSTLSLHSGQGPVEITAKQLEFDYKKLELVYEGDVKAQQGDMTLEADRLSILLDDRAANLVRRITAEGRVRIAQGERVATGSLAVFDQDSRTVTLTGSAVLRQGPNEVAGERVRVYLDEERSVVEGGQQRVRARLYPSEKRSGEGDEEKRLSENDDER